MESVSSGLSRLRRKTVMAEVAGTQLRLCLVNCSRSASEGPMADLKSTLRSHEHKRSVCEH